MIRRAATGAMVAGAGVGWTLALPLVWVSVPLLAQLALPRIDPDPEVVVRPLEQLSTMALVITVAHLCWLLGDTASWVSAASPRPMELLRAMWATLLGLLGSAMLALVSVTLPHGVGLTHTLMEWLTLYGLGLLGTALLGRSAAAVLPAITICVASVGGSALWPWSAFYNLDARVPISTWAIGSLLLGLIAYAVLGEREARRGARGLRTDDHARRATSG